MSGVTVADGSHCCAAFGDVRRGRLWSRFWSHVSIQYPSLGPNGDAYIAVFTEARRAIDEVLLVVSPPLAGAVGQIVHVVLRGEHSGRPESRYQDLEPGQMLCKGWAGRATERCCNYHCIEARRPLPEMWQWQVIVSPGSPRTGKNVGCGGDKDTDAEARGATCTLGCRLGLGREKWNAGNPVQGVQQMRAAEACRWRNR